jgi:hypothetical protein
MQDNLLLCAAIQTATTAVQALINMHCSNGPLFTAYKSVMSKKELGINRLTSRCSLAYPPSWLSAATWKAAAQSVVTPAAAGAPGPRSMHPRDAQTLLWKMLTAEAADHWCRVQTYRWAP